MAEEFRGVDFDWNWYSKCSELLNGNIYEIISQANGEGYLHLNSGSCLQDIDVYTNAHTLKIDLANIVDPSMITRFIGKFRVYPMFDFAGKKIEDYSKGNKVKVFFHSNNSLYFEQFETNERVSDLHIISYSNGKKGTNGEVLINDISTSNLSISANELALSGFIESSSINIGINSNNQLSGSKFNLNMHRVLGLSTEHLNINISGNYGSGAYLHGKIGSKLIKTLGEVAWPQSLPSLNMKVISPSLVTSDAEVSANSIIIDARGSQNGVIANYGKLNGYKEVSLKGKKIFSYKESIISALGKSGNVAIEGERFYGDGMGLSGDTIKIEASETASSYSSSYDYPLFFKDSYINANNLSLSSKSSALIERAKILVDNSFNFYSSLHSNYNKSYVKFSNIIAKNIDFRSNYRLDFEDSMIEAKEWMNISNYNSVNDDNSIVVINKSTKLYANNEIKITSPLIYCLGLLDSKRDIQLNSDYRREYSLYFEPSSVLMANGNIKFAKINYIGLRGVFHSKGTITLEAAKQIKIQGAIVSNYLVLEAPVISADYENNNELQNNASKYLGINSASDKLIINNAKLRSAESIDFKNIQINITQADIYGKNFNLYHSKLTINGNIKANQKLYISNSQVIEKLGLVIEIIEWMSLSDSSITSDRKITINANENFDFHRINATVNELNFNLNSATNYSVRISDSKITGKEAVWNIKARNGITIEKTSYIGKGLRFESRAIGIDELSQFKGYAPDYSSISADGNKDFNFVANDISIMSSIEHNNNIYIGYFQPRPNYITLGNQKNKHIDIISHDHDIFIYILERDGRAYSKFEKINLIAKKGLIDIESAIGEFVDNRIIAKQLRIYSSIDGNNYWRKLKLNSASLLLGSEYIKLKGFGEIESKGGRIKTDGELEMNVSSRIDLDQNSVIEAGYLTINSRQERRVDLICKACTIKVTDPNRTSNIVVDGFYIDAIGERKADLGKVVYQELRGMYTDYWNNWKKNNINSCWPVEQKMNYSSAKNGAGDCRIHFYESAALKGAVDKADYPSYVAFAGNLDLDAKSLKVKSSLFTVDNKLRIEYKKAYSYDRLRIEVDSEPGKRGIFFYHSCFKDIFPELRSCLGLGNSAIGGYTDQRLNFLESISGKIFKPTGFWPSSHFIAEFCQIENNNIPIPLGMIYAREISISSNAGADLNVFTTGPSKPYSSIQGQSIGDLSIAHVLSNYRPSFASSSSYPAIAYNSVTIPSNLIQIKTLEDTQLSIKDFFAKHGLNLAYLINLSKLDSSMWYVNQPLIKQLISSSLALNGSSSGSSTALAKNCVEGNN